MKIAILGTGMVGSAHAAKLAGQGHNVMVGTRDPAAKSLKGVKLAGFAEAAKHGEVIIEALNGNAALKVLKPLKSQLAGKILIDISNPLDFSKGYLRLSVCNDDSLGEQVQKALPGTKVVKAFNTMNVTIQIDPKSVAKGGHSLFIAGNDQAAKAKVAKLARDWYGWSDDSIIDLGDIKSARGMEMILPIWLNLRGKFDSPAFNFRIVR